MHLIHRSEQVPNQPKELTMVEKVNKALFASKLLGRCNAIIYSEMSVDDMIQIHTHYPDAPLRLLSLPTRPHMYYMMIEVEHLKFFSVDLYR